jgi:hypothetical protein
MIFCFSLLVILAPPVRGHSPTRAHPKGKPPSAFPREKIHIDISMELGC